MTDVRAHDSLRNILIGMILVISATACDRKSDSTVVFAGARDVWWTAPTIIAVDEKLAEGIEVQELKFASGRDSMNAVLNGNADIGLVASTPLAMEAAKGSDLKVLGIYVQSETLISFLSLHKIEPAFCRADPAKCAENAAKLLTVFVPNTISQFYLLQYLEACGLDEGQVKDVMGRALLVQPPCRSERLRQ